MTLNVSVGRAGSPGLAACRGRWSGPPDAAGARAAPPCPHAKRCWTCGLAAGAAPAPTGASASARVFSTSRDESPRGAAPERGSMSGALPPPSRGRASPGKGRLPAPSADGRRRGGRGGTEPGRAPNRARSRGGESGGRTAGCASA